MRERQRERVGKKVKPSEKETRRENVRERAKEAASGNCEKVQLPFTLGKVGRTPKKLFLEKNRETQDANFSNFDKKIEAVKIS